MRHKRQSTFVRRPGYSIMMMNNHRHHDHHPKTTRRRSSSSSLSLLLSSLSSSLLLWIQCWMIVGLVSTICCSSSRRSSSSMLVESYPLLATVPRNTNRCFRFNVPIDDDAHMIFLAVPSLGVEDTNSKGLEDVEAWFVNEVYELTKLKSVQKIPNKLLRTPPPEIETKMDHFIDTIGQSKSGVLVRIGKKNVDTSQKQRYMSYTAKYFSPTVLPQIRKTMPIFGINSRNKGKQQQQEQEQQEQDEQEKKKDDATDIEPSEEELIELEGYEVCLDNSNNHQRSVEIILDIVLVSTDINNEEQETEQDGTGNTGSTDGMNGIEKEKHITPLEESLTKSIDVAHQVMKELRNIGEREDRMRKVTDRINSRVQFFSILSVIVLMGVSYIQISYLHRYFHKRKLL